MKREKSLINCLRRVLKDILTGRDNNTYDLARVIYVYTLHIFCVGECFEIWHSKVFNELDFAGGIAALTTAFSVMIFIKKDTEPSA